MFEKDIVEGITILNRHDHGWAHRINVDELDMAHPTKDILHQLYGNNEEMYWKMSADYRKSEAFCGFTIQDDKGILYQPHGDNEEMYWKILVDYRRSETFCGFTIQDAEAGDPRWAILTREWQRVIRRIQENIPADEPFEATLGSLWEREG